MSFQHRSSKLWVLFTHHTKKHVSASKNNFAMESLFYPIILNTEKKMYTNEKNKKWKKDGCLATLGPPPIGFQLI